MNTIDLISLVKDPAKESYKLKNNFIKPSIIIAHAIYCFENGLSTESSIKNKYSLFDKKRNYKSYLSCINSIQSKFSVSVSVEEFVNNIYGEKDKDVSDIVNAYTEIIQMNELIKIDDDSIISNVANSLSVDTVEESFIDVYVVRKTYNSLDSELIKTQDKNEAIKVCKNNKGYSTYNSKGEEVFSNTMPPEKVKRTIDVVVAGLPVDLDKCNMYAKATDRIPARAITGTFYIYNGKCVNKKYAICYSQEFIKKGDEYIMGYINSSDIK